MHASHTRILLTGATGYVGGRLLPLLSGRDDLRVRCMVRNPARLTERVGEEVQLVEADAMDADAVGHAMRDVDIAFYLIHALGGGSDFAEQERQAARHFAQAAEAAGVKRIIYLGGLGDDASTSPHLASRRAVGEILRNSSVPTIEFRASIVIGSGSLSFELVRALTRKLPVMVVPKWGRSLAQPIAIEDVLAYLTAAVDIDAPQSTIYEIGGPDRVSYIDLMREYARQRGLLRLFVPVPVLTPRLSSWWLALVTPVYARIGRKLIDSCSTPTVVNDDAALRDFAIQPRGCRAAIERALGREDEQFARTRWSDALSSVPGKRTGFGGHRYGSRLLDTRVVDVDVPPAQAFVPIRRIGGRVGWYRGNLLWKLRGLLDVFAGGVGLRRGRRDPDHLAVGDTLDFWRVEAYEPDRMLRLRAEMRLPGRAWLQFEVEPTESGSRIRQTAEYDPRGVLGLAYWYVVWPLHEYVFGGMLRRIGQIARQTPVPDAGPRAG